MTRCVLAWSLAAWRESFLSLSLASLIDGGTLTDGWLCGIGKPQAGIAGIDHSTVTSHFDTFDTLTL